MNEALAAMNMEPEQVHGYGKGAIVGENGELEHAAAALHVRLGKTMWPVLRKASALIPATKRIGGPGAEITVPLGHKDDAWDPSHWDAMQLSTPDAPRADEIVVIIVLTDGGRPLYRVGDHRPDLARKTA